jgi:hypothetical protein
MINEDCVIHMAWTLLYYKKVAVGHLLKPIVAATPEEHIVSLNVACLSRQDGLNE